MSPEPKFKKGDLIWTSKYSQIKCKSCHGSIIRPLDVRQVRIMRVHRPDGCYTMYRLDTSNPHDVIKEPFLTEADARICLNIPAGMKPPSLCPSCEKYNTPNKDRVTRAELDHFLSCIDFKKTFLDADAIDIMNRFGTLFNEGVYAKDQS